MLPKHILKSLEKNQTSVGDNPCLPPEEETKFLVALVGDYFDGLSNDNETDEKELRNELGGLISQCIKAERENVNALEQICVSCVTDLFDIPSDTIKISGKIVSKVNSDTERLYPEKTEKYSFEDINDMTNLSDEIYKRRMLNALVMGASLYYMNNFKPYFQKVFEINPELPALYKRILTLNELSLYYCKDNLSQENSDGGKVDVNISSQDNMVSIEAEAVIFPILFCELIKGLLELSTSHGLPENREKAMYVISKADFKLAEVWDMRIGLPLWKQIVSLIEEVGFSAEETGINFILMYLAMMPVEEFNADMKEIFAKTKRGKQVLSSMLNDIERNKEQDDFDDYITQMNNKPQIDDDDYYQPEDLIVDCENW